MYIAWILACLSIFNMVLSLVSASVYTMFWSCREDGFLWLRWWFLLPHLESCLSCLGSLFPSLWFGQFRSGVYWSCYKKHRQVSNSHRSSDWSYLPRCLQFGSIDGLTTHGFSSKPCLHHYKSCLLCLFWRVRFLEISFETITYRHIPREHNVVAKSLANHILDWLVPHSWHENKTWFIVIKL